MENHLLAGSKPLDDLHARRTAVSRHERAAASSTTNVHHDCAHRDSALPGKDSTSEGSHTTIRASRR